MKPSSASKRSILELLSRPLVANRMLSRIAGARFAPFDMVFTDVWRRYLLDHHEAIDFNLSALCEGMDDESAAIAHAVAERYFYIAPPCAYDNVVRYRTDLLFTPYEKALQVEFGRLMSIREKEGYRLPDKHNDLSISVFATHNGLDFIPEVRSRLQDGIAIDGGAFIGDSALAISKFGPRSIFCFEPDAANREFMKQTIADNALDNVVVVAAGLGGTQTTAQSTGGDSRTQLSTRGDGAGQGGIPITTIDCFCNAKNIHPSLIKLDIEGMEYDAVMGARSMIADCKPMLVVSIYHTPRDFFEIKPLLLALRPDYRMMIRRLDPFHPTNETVLIAY